MDQNQLADVTSQVPPLTPEDAAAGREIIDQVFSIDLDQALSEIEAIYHTKFPQFPEAQRAALEPLMQALWSQFKALELLGNQENLPKASQDFQTAARIFDQLGFHDLRDLSIGMSVYAAAVVMLQQLNVGQALE
jgi:hypothetical protein